MGTIIQFLRGGARLQDSVFEPHAIKAMSMALDDVCSALKLRDGDGSAKEVIAARIIDLARHGERSPNAFANECFTRRAWLNTLVLERHEQHKRPSGQSR